MDVCVCLCQSLLDKTRESSMKRKASYLQAEINTSKIILAYLCNVQINVHVLKCMDHIHINLLSSINYIGNQCVVNPVCF